MKFRALIIVIVLALASSGIPAIAATTPDELLKRAKDSRQKAEQALAETRKKHLDERREVAAQLQKAYEDLAAVRKEAQQAGEKLEHVKQEIAGSKRNDAEIARRIQTMLVNIQTASETEINEMAPVDEVKFAISKDMKRQIAGIDRQSKITIATESIKNRKGESSSVAVLRLGNFAAYACGPTHTSCGLLQASKENEWMIVGPYLNDAAREALRIAAENGHAAQVPLDPTSSLQDRTPSEPASLQSWLATGGLFVIPILVVGALGILLIIERVICLALHKTPTALIVNFLAKLKRGEFEAAKDLLGNSQTPISRVLRAGLESTGFPQTKRESAMESAVLCEAPRLERSLSLLGALAGVAPLLGLLGTVSGMISTFDTISGAGTSNPKLLSGGISEALITTQLGLVIAVPLLLAYATISRWVERRQALLEHYAIQAFSTDDAEAEQTHE